ncbi:hypothetical protein CWI42_042020 [Ordospora colligata]|uniref:Uncharacterized protein n=1 Tax=Ordospora colligata OC4 TaxID=1354746 RepID=A0A0B2UKV8_9MICR|nr:uncharacterized protein M896_042030 [Ordospora colligata OC4]KHN70003.1 hypothetical protein M896_042030 [Ordospora colligata OC4]TBU16173.1 hypothetical protein CWI41_042020 [Ordospora colligata]TBU16386.1 hypothetical protein CWI40_042020 [Ordospora colligata]TBU19090.1 hypothetical protein CWI42_042020 [Ordospora colligata]
MDERIELCVGIDYMARGSRSKITDSVCIRKPVVVVSPYKSKCLDIMIAVKGMQEIVVTPNDLVELLDGVDGDNYAELSKQTHIIVENGQLMESFGYLPELLELKRRGKSFVILNMSSQPVFASNAVVLTLDKYFIEANGDDRYAVVFMLCRIYKRVCIVCREYKRMRMFADIFKLEVLVCRHKDVNVGSGVVVVMDEFREFECEVLFYIGKSCKGLQRKRLDASKMGKYLYRVRDVCGALSPNVVSGKQKLDAGRFCNIDR